MSRPAVAGGRPRGFVLVVACGLLGVVLGVAAWSLADPGAIETASADSAARAASSTAAVARLRSAVDYLASDELEGRGIRTNGIELAADYIAAQFQNIGLRTDLFDGKPFQHFLRRSRLDLGSANSVSLRSPDGEELPLQLREHFTPLSLSGSGAFDLPLVFVGYGISDHANRYDDYAGVDVKGKAVIVLRHEPVRGAVRAEIAEPRNSEHAYLGRKIANAVEHGAAAVILVNDLNAIKRTAAERNLADFAPDDPELDPLLGFQTRTKLESRDVPVVHCRRGPIDHMVRATLNMTLRELEEKIDGDLAPHSRELTGWKIAGEVSVLEKGKSLKNVLGVLEGAGPNAEETVIIGAHYDHLGYGGWGSLAFDAENEIHNGADDNASGTAVMLEIARRLAAADLPSRRRVVFIAFTAEEMGLVGSEYYVREPLVPLKNTVAMLNLDMVGRLRNDRLAVQGTGTAKVFEPLIDTLGTKYGLNISKQSGGYGPSDHSTFYEHGIPVMHFFTGLHADYHRPTDDADKLNLSGMDRIAGLVTDVAIALITQSERPKLIRPELNLVMGLDDLGDFVDPDETSAVVGREPYLGVAADRSRDVRGYAVGRVTPGSAAERAGIQVGDVIVRIGGQELAEPKDLPAAVAKRKVGETVTLTIRRGSLELEIDVTLAPR